MEKRNQRGIVRSAGGVGLFLFPRSPAGQKGFAGGPVQFFAKNEAEKRSAEQRGDDAHGQLHAAGQDRARGRVGPEQQQAAA